MKLGRRILVMAIALVLLCATFAIAAFAEETDSVATRAVSGQWTYTITNGTAKITAYSGTATIVTIPDTIDGYRVTALGDSVFADKATLTSITFNNNLESIGSEAFRNCTSLSTITLPLNLTSVGYHAFYNCTNLSSITINSKNLSDFSYDSCFYNAGKYAANGITVTFGNEVTRIPRYLFKCDQKYYARIKSVKIGSGVTNISDSAFVNCFDLTTVTWGNSLVTIGSDAFNNCTNLTSVALPESLETLGYHAFYNCTGLTSVTINAKKLGDLSYDSCFYNAGKNATNGICVTFGNTVTRIPRYIFKSSESNYVRLKTVKMGSAITFIGECAFENCLDINNITWGKRVSTISSYAFMNCRNISTVSLPSSVTDIGYQAFCSCKKLTRLDVNNPSCTLYGNKDTLGVPGSTVIYGYRNSTAQTYANKYGYSFVPIDRFTDVPSNAYYAAAVAWAVENGVTSGTSATTFSPNADCTRAQVVTFLWRAAGSPNPKSSRNPFSDVKSGAYYYKAVLWAVENKITSGTSSTTFSPDASCTRAQVVTFLWRYEGNPAPSSNSNPFKDVNSSSYYYTAVLWAVGRKVTSGTSSNTFSPNATCTRAQVVTFLYRDIS